VTFRGAVVAVTLAIATAGCSASSAGRSSSPASSGSTASGARSQSSAAVRPVATSGTPGCGTGTAAARVLPEVRTATVSVAGNPFGVAVSADGRWTFAALSSAGSVGVFRSEGSGAPAAVRSVAVAPGQPLGEALTRDGRYLLAANALGGATVIDTSRAEQGMPAAVLGTLSAPAGSGAIEVAVSPDDRFAFVSLEGSAVLAVFSLQRALVHGFSPSDFVGTIPVGEAPVGLAVSPDGRWLYATSEIERGPRPSGGPQLGPQGTLTVINLRRAETDPGGSVMSSVTAGCSPVRVIVSANGSVIWVTARGSDFLLGFSAARLLSDPAHARIARVRVGAAPVGLALVDNGTRIAVADSNRFSAPGATSSLAVVSVTAALAGRPALLGYVRTGGFPREMALEPGGRTLLVTDFSSQQLEAVNVTGLPEQAPCPASRVLCPA
jgi:DNA-binding beta-propeller fold protein YncE